MRPPKGVPPTAILALCALAVVLGGIAIMCWFAGRIADGVVGGLVSLLLFGSAARVHRNRQKEK